jgi:hypothetical protein
MGLRSSGRLEEALERYRAALAIYVDEGDIRGQGRMTEAEGHYNAAVDAARMSKNRSLMASS